MKKFLTGTIAAAAIALAVPALAADMAPRYSKAPMAPPVMVYNWTGCYIGGNVGGGWARTEQSQIALTDGTVRNPPLDLGSGEGSNFIGGAQVGCDYQFAGNFVVGVQGMFDFGKINSTHLTLPAQAGFFSQDATKNLYTATARVGYLFAPQVLGYVKGGGAWTQADSFKFGAGPPVFASESSVNADRTGWTVGAGLEWMFVPGWSVFGEYNYMDFGKKDIASVAAPGTIGAPDIERTRLTVQTAIVGVNYKFNWGGPVVAKY